MMPDQARLDFQPATHAGDPAPAGDAERRITVSGTRQTHAHMVQTAVTAAPGASAAKYGALTGLGHVSAQRRLSDLKNLNLVRLGPPVDDGYGLMSSWWPVPVEERHA